MDMFQEDYIWTPWYDQYPTPDNTTECKVGSSNYITYDLYALKTWLYPYIQEKYGYDVIIAYDKKTKGLLSYNVIKLLRTPEELVLTTDDKIDINNKIQTLITPDKINYLLISPMDVKIDGYAIPQGWIKQMLSFISVNDAYLPYVSEYGLAVNLRPIPEYTYLYTRLSSSIYKTLRDMYIYGYIYNPPDIVIKNWKLDQLGPVGLYRFPIKDSRISSYLSDFLLQIKEDGVITIKQEVNPNPRYIISHLMTKYSNNLEIILNDFTISKVVNNLEQATQFYDMYEYILSEIDKFNYDIHYYPVSTYDEATSIINNSENGVIYLSSDPEVPYVASNLSIV